MARALINSEILQWAVGRTSKDLADLAKSVGVRDADRVMLWLEGDERPTFRQAQKLANALCIPFGFLYLDEPPEDAMPIPDLRTIGDEHRGEMSPALYDTLSGVVRNHAWYRDYLIDQGATPLPFVGRFDVTADPQAVAADIAAILALTAEDRQQARDYEAFMKCLVERAEDAGIWVMRNGVVGNNTQRALDVDEFRGFAIADDIVPLVFINNRDAKAAQIFTLVHELAHIWLGAGGVSDLPLDEPDEAPHGSIEAMCNRTAAELLVPAEEMKAHWNPAASPEENFGNIANVFRVSHVMAARRCLDLDFIDWATFMEFYRGEQKRWNKRSSGGGGDYYANVRVRNGKRFTRDVCSSALAGNLLRRSAGRMLGVAPSKVALLGGEG